MGIFNPLTNAEGLEAGWPNEDSSTSSQSTEFTASFNGFRSQQEHSESYVDSRCVCWQKEDPVWL